MKPEEHKHKWVGFAPTTRNFPTDAQRPLYVFAVYCETCGEIKTERIYS